MITAHQFQLRDGDLAAIRPSKREDLQQLVAIERLSFPYPWGRSEFKLWLGAKRFHGVSVLLPHGDIAGFAIYSCLSDERMIHNLAVHPEWRRLGIGSELVRYVTEVGNPAIQMSVTSGVNEGNVAGQLFFRSLGFRLSMVNRNPYEETDEDEYVFICHAAGS